MVKLNINLDESLKAFADEQVALGRARDVDELVAALLAEARDMEGDRLGNHGGRPISDDLEASLLKADADPGTPMTEQDWESLRRIVNERHSQGR